MHVLPLFDIADPFTEAFFCKFSKKWVLMVVMNSSLGSNLAKIDLRNKYNLELIIRAQNHAYATLGSNTTAVFVSHVKATLLIN